jgi:hypothetical protein
MAWNWELRIGNWGLRIGGWGLGAGEVRRTVKPTQWM